MILRRRMLVVVVVGRHYGIMKTYEFYRGSYIADMGVVVCCV